MKPTMLFAIIMLTVIVLITSFDLQIASVAPIDIPPEMSGNVLYVCPVDSPSWDAFANAVRPFTKYITIMFFFAMMVLLFHWGWALYQNLLKDKLDEKSFKNAWTFTKFLFWAGVIVSIAIATPNHFRRVHLTGANGEYILCEANTPGARAVRSDAVHR